jgi:hypothetical protein
VLVSPDGRWLAVSLNRTENPPSMLTLIDLVRWREIELEQLESPVPQNAGSLVWSRDSRQFAGIRSVAGARPSDLWVVDVTTRASRSLVEVELGDFDRWTQPELSSDGTQLFALGFQSDWCCGIDVEGAPYLAVFDLAESGAASDEVARIPLDGVLIGQQFEPVFEDGGEYNFLRNPAFVPSADRNLMYIVHADADRITVVDLAAATAEVEEIIRPSSALSRFGGWLASRLVSRVEAKGGVYQRKEAQLSADGGQLYVTGVSDIVCEEIESFACLEGHPLGLQVVDLATMRLAAEFPGINRIAATPDGTRVVGIGSEHDYRHVENDRAREIGFGATVVDVTSLEMIAHIAPDVAFSDIAVSADGRWAYLLSAGPGVDPMTLTCSERCTRLTVIDLADGTTAATRLFESRRLQLVSLAAAP